MTAINTTQAPNTTFAPEAKQPVLPADAEIEKIFNSEVPDFLPTDEELASIPEVERNVQNPNDLEQELLQDSEQSKLELESKNEALAKEGDKSSNDWFAKIAKNHPLVAKFVDRFGLISNGFAFVFHGLSSVAPYLEKTFSKAASDKINDFTIAFARYVVPLNFVKNGINAMRKNNLIEGLIRWSLPAFLATVPFFNFVLPYGLHSGASIIYDAAQKVLTARGKETFDSFGDNVKSIFGATGEVIKSFKHGMGMNQWMVISGLSMLIGSVGGYVFAKDERSSLSAKAFMWFRTFGGGFGDLLFMLERPENLMKVKDGWKDFKTACKINGSKKLVGVFAGIASLLSPFLRFVKNEKPANVIGHVMEACNNFAYTLWGYACEKKDLEIKDVKKANKTITSLLKTAVGDVDSGSFMSKMFNKLMDFLDKDSNNMLVDKVLAKQEGSTYEASSPIPSLDAARKAREAAMREKSEMMAQYAADQSSDLQQAA